MQACHLLCMYSGPAASSFVVPSVRPKRFAFLPSCVVRTSCVHIFSRILLIILRVVLLTSKTLPLHPNPSTITFDPSNLVILAHFLLFFDPPRPQFPTPTSCDARFGSSSPTHYSLRNPSSKHLSVRVLLDPWSLSISSSSRFNPCVSLFFVKPIIFLPEHTRSVRPCWRTHSHTYLATVGQV